MTNKNDLFESIHELLVRDTDLKTMQKELWRQFGGRCATLVLDCCKFTRITQEAGIVYYLICLIKLNDIIRPIFEEHGCLSFRPEEDNIYAEFETPDQALAASIEANQAVKAANLMLNEHEPFQICIGIGYGNVLFSRNNGVFGDEMNLASKLGEDIAEGEEILLTEAAYANIDHKYKNGFERKSISIAGVTISFYSLKLNRLTNQVF
jgi:adenylate cyclase